MTEHDSDRPNVEAARRNLEEARKRRPDVARLVEALKREQRLNGFTASVTVVLRGGRDGRHA